MAGIAEEIPLRAKVMEMRLRSFMMAEGEEKMIRVGKLDCFLSLFCLWNCDRQLEEVRCSYSRADDGMIALCSL